MALSEEMKKMVDTVNIFDEKLRNNNSMIKRYVAPDIPQKILEKVVKYFDGHIGANSIVAIYDDTIFGTMKSGIIFTNDGIYFKDILTKPVYFRYIDIISSRVDGSNLDIEVAGYPNGKYIHVSGFDKAALRDVLVALKAIDNEYGQTSLKESGEVGKIDIPKSMLIKCNAIIHSASVACGGVGTGLAQIPASDNAVIVPIQIAMIVALGEVFDLNITESGAKSIIASAVATITGRTISQFLVGWIPGIGNAINTATAAGVTEAIGWIAVRNFYARWIEDKNKGRIEGMKDGYVEASGEYERKLRKQAEAFLSQMKDVKKEFAEYETLLADYEKYIEELEASSSSPKSLEEMKNIYGALKDLS